MEWKSFRLTKSAAASQLQAYLKSGKLPALKELFKQDPKRFDQFHVRLPQLLFDYSKQRVDRKVMELLFQTAREAGVEAARDDLFQGKRINATENRAVLHMALRAEVGDSFEMDGESVLPEVLRVRNRMLDFAEQLRSDERVRDVVNIGIGGSDLGPHMAVRALRRFHTGPRVHFVSNVDRAHLDAVLSKCDPASTQFIVVSKTFTTAETMLNASAAKAWFIQRSGGNPEGVGTAFAAVSSSPRRAADFGIPMDRVFGFEDWVGGRFSMWGPVGCALAVAIGSQAFLRFLAGARAADLHFREAPLEQNVPMLSGLLGIYNSVFLGHKSWAVLPYAQDCDRLPAYLQQADMESNGKGVNRQGNSVDVPTSTVVWGEPGTNGQHAFHQLLHQGSEAIPVDFIAFREPTGSDAAAHRVVIAHAIAQAEALLVGRKRDIVEQEMRERGADETQILEVAPHRVFSGNRPSNFWMWNRLDPWCFGMLIAFQEHRIFVQGVLLGVYSFDQWGVELGKGLASEIERELVDEHVPVGSHDVSTTALMWEFLRQQE